MPITKWCSPLSGKCLLLMYSNPHHCGFFTVEWELWMSIINLSFVMLDETVCLSNLPVQPPGSIWYFKVKAFTLKHLDPNLPIASTINTGTRGGQNSAELSAAVFISYHLCETAEYSKHEQMSIHVELDVELELTPELWRHLEETGLDAHKEGTVWGGIWRDGLDQPLAQSRAQN